MKVTAIIQSQSVRVVRVMEGDFGYFPDAARALVEQYGFVGIPSRAEEILVEQDKPVTFSHGRLVVQDKTLIIDHLHIYRTGMVVATHSGTNDSDVVADHVLNWAAQTFHVKFETLKPNAYSSQLEVRFERPLESHFHQSRGLSATIGGLMGKEYWGQPLSSIELTSVVFSSDPSTFSEGLNPPRITVERRVGFPFEQNLYFSEAPMTTSAHETFLSTLEDL